VSSSRAKGGVSVLTWNVWFGDRHEANEAMAKRCDAILDYLGSIGADIMCLQEVTETLLEKMKKASWVKADYDLSRDTVTSSPL
jgi:endonuclease/exonuclease/phosphatase family metal-dependent hydrolase